MITKKFKKNSYVLSNKGMGIGVIKNCHNNIFGNLDSEIVYEVFYYNTGSLKFCRSSEIDKY